MTLTPDADIRIFTALKRGDYFDFAAENARRAFRRRRRSLSVLSQTKASAVMVRAKVTCEGIKDNAVTFRTVYEGDAAKADTENARFTKATPWGEIKLGIDNPAALEQFAPGKSYYVDFTETA